MASPRRKKRFLFRVRNTGCEDLELRKLYEHLPDDVAAREGYVRVVDEFGEDYLYPKTYFVAVRLPGEAERALARRPLSGLRLPRGDEMPGCNDHCAGAEPLIREVRVTNTGSSSGRAPIESAWREGAAGAPW